MAKKPTTSKTVEALKHDEVTRKNIPTAEYQSVMQKNEQDPVRVAYERRNRDLDPQLVWRGKDEQDWSDLVVHAPPLYIQEKVHPKVLIDDLVRRTQVDAKAAAPQFDLFADFNGMPRGVDKTEFYQHDQNWSNRMILGDSLQVMASLAEREGLRGKVQCIYLDPPYGMLFKGSYTTVSVYTQKYRQKKRQAYHELTFLPGEAAQIDWIEERLPWGTAYGFAMILAYSRYLYVRFYPRQSLEFFLEGHIEAHREMGGVAHRHWYDNIKTVVIERSPELKFNAQFLDFARHFSFSIHLCNPYRANEKGKIERALKIRGT